MPSRELPASAATLPGTPFKVEVASLAITQVVTRSDGVTLQFDGMRIHKPGHCPFEREFALDKLLFATAEFGAGACL